MRARMPAETSDPILVSSFLRPTMMLTKSPARRAGTRRVSAPRPRGIHYNGKVKRPLWFSNYAFMLPS